MHPARTGMTFLLRTLLLAGGLALPLTLPAESWLRSLFGPRDIEVITNTDLTPEGRAWPLATRAAPQYYVSVSAGFQDFGGVIAGIDAPPPAEVVKMLTAELAKQGYRAATEDTPPPTLVLFFTWGSLNTDTVSDADGNERQRNRQQILRFLGGAKAGLDDGGLEPFTAPVAGLTAVDADARDLLDAATEDFFVAVVSAYDLASVQAGNRRLLWTTRIATFSRGFDFAETLPAMLAIGGAHFGRETNRPAWMRASEKFRPDTTPGEIRVLDYTEPSRPPAAEKKP